MHDYGTPQEKRFFYACFMSQLLKELPRVDRARNPVGDDEIKTLVT